MSKGLSTGLAVVGVLLIIVGLVNHYVLKTNIVPHTSIGLGVLGVIVGGIGVFGLMSSGKAA
jgi:hypothetical protein